MAIMKKICKAPLFFLIKSIVFVCAFLIIPVNIFFYWTWDNYFHKNKRKPRLLFGTTPIISLVNIALALRERGYLSHIVVAYESPIYDRKFFDIVLLPNPNKSKLFRFFAGYIIPYWYFIKAIWVYDIFHYYFEAGILKNTWFYPFELWLLKLSGKKIILFPYGSDAFVYDEISNPIWRHALMVEYGALGRSAKKIQQRIRHMCSLADIVVACLVHYVNLPRWDILPLLYYPIDVKKIKPIFPNGNRHSPIKIAHACNHRGVKGTIFLIEAINRLCAEGIVVKLDIIEKVENTEALKRISECDIYVDQLVFGYAQAALEAMAFGKVVISGLDDTLEYNLFRNFSYLNECPIIPANINTIYDVLKGLILNRNQFAQLGLSCRNFVEKRHSFESCVEMYEAIYNKIWLNDNHVDLINFYHPLSTKPKMVTSGAEIVQPNTTNSGSSAHL